MFLRQARVYIYINERPALPFFSFNYMHHDNLAQTLEDYRGALKAHLTAIANDGTVANPDRYKRLLDRLYELETGIRQTCRLLDTLYSQKVRKPWLLPLEAKTNQLIDAQMKKLDKRVRRHWAEYRDQQRRKRHDEVRRRWNRFLGFKKK